MDIKEIEKKIQIQAEGGRDTDSWSWFLSDAGKSAIEFVFIFFVFCMLYVLSLFIPLPDFLNFVTTTTLFIFFAFALIFVNMFSAKARFFLFARVYQNWDAVFFPRKIEQFRFSLFGIKDEKKIIEFAKSEGRRFFEALGIFWRQKKWAEHASKFREQGLIYVLRYHLSHVFIREHFLKIFFALTISVVSFFVFVFLSELTIAKKEQKMPLPRAEIELRMQKYFTEEELRQLNNADVFNRTILQQQLFNKYYKQAFNEVKREKIKEKLKQKHMIHAFYSLLVFILSLLYFERKYIISLIVYLKQKRTIFDRINAFFMDIETDTEIALLRSLAVSYLKKLKFANLDEKIYIGKATGMLEKIATVPAQCFSLNDVYLYEDDMYTNLLVIGGIGTGKTAGVIQPAIYQLCKKNDRSFIVFDPKRELFDFIEQNFSGKSYKKIVVGERGQGVNLIGLFSSHELESHLIEFSDDMKGSDSFWYTQAARFIRTCLDFLIMVSRQKNEDISIITFAKVQSFVRKIRDENFVKMLENYKETKEYQNLQAFLAMPSDTFGSIIANAELFLSVADIPYLNSEKEKLDKYTHLEEDVVIYVDIPSSGIASKIARFLLFKYVFKNTLSRLAYEINKDRKVFFIVDEMQEVVTSKALSDLAMSRAAKLCMIAATQSISQLYANMGKEKADTILANFRNKIFLQTDDVATIEKIQKIIEVYDLRRSVQINETWTTGRQTQVGTGFGKMAGIFTTSSVTGGFATLMDIVGGTTGFTLHTSKSFTKGQSISIQSKPIPSSYIYSIFTDFTAIFINNFGNTLRYDFIELKPIFLYEKEV